MSIETSISRVGDRIVKEMRALGKEVRSLAREARKETSTVINNHVEDDGEGRGNQGEIDGQLSLFDASNPAGFIQHSTPEGGTRVLATTPWEISQVRTAPYDSALPAGTTPTRANPTDAGLDLYASEGYILEAGATGMLNTNIKVAIPVGFVGLVCPRSGLSAKHAVTVTNGPGIVDSGYRGELKVLLTNHGPDAVHFQAGDRIAQLVVVPCLLGTTGVLDTDDRGERGEAGFGSTGR